MNQDNDFSRFAPPGATGTSDAPLNEAQNVVQEQTQERIAEEKETQVFTPEWNSDSYAQPTYYENVIAQSSEKKESKALEICALVFGILSIVTCCCCGVFGVVGLVLSIIALAKGKKSGLSVAGLICSIIGLLLSIAMVCYSFSEEGQEMWDAYEEGFQEGYSSTYGGDLNLTTEEATEEVTESVESTESAGTVSGTTVASDVDTVVIDGVTFVLPCTMADIMLYYEADEYSKEDVENAMEPDERRYICLAKNGDVNGMSVSLCNETGEKLDDVSKATVYAIDVNNAVSNPIEKAVFYNGIELNQDKATLEKKLEGISYEKNSDEDYDYYSFYAGANEEYSYFILVMDGVVASVEVRYYEMSE